MVEVKEQYPFIDEEGATHENLVKHWAEDENGQAYKILQNETGAIYDTAIDVYPCKYTYSATEEIIEEPVEEVVEGEVVNSEQQSAQE